MNISELRRNYWLFFSWHRLIAVPLIIYLIYFLVFWALKTRNSSLFDGAVDVNLANFSPVFVGTSSFLFTVIVLIWGTLSAASSVSHEVHDNTWDTQRLSTISAWSMAVGKLFGSTLTSWYAAAFILPVYLVAIFYSTDNREHLLVGVLVSILGAIFAHSLAIAVSLLSLQKKHQVSLLASFLTTVDVLIVHFFLQALGGVGIYLSTTREGVFDDFLPSSWYVFSLTNPWIGVFFVFLFTFWAIFALYRMMRSELQYRNTVFGWVAFLLFLCSFVLGFSFDEYFSLSLEINILLLFLVYLGLMYTVLFFEPKKVVVFRKFFYAIRKGNINLFFQVLPKWVVTFLALVISYGAYFLFGGTLDHDIVQIIENTAWGNYPIRMIGLAVIFFVLRDIALLLLLHVNIRNKRADFAFSLYLILLYVLFPSLLGIANLPFFFLVPDPRTTLLSIGSALLEGLLLWGIVGYVWHRLLTRVK